MKIAIEGCCHGALDTIYQQIKTLEGRNNYKVELLLICGDFQAIRNHRDLQCMAVPQKYRQLGDFYKYYTGEKVAPVLTIVIGGNHEASNYLWELYHGGWLAPNIYFLGHAGCIQVNGIRIAGISGIFKYNDFHQGHHERIPYDHGSMRSIYHIREYNIRRLSLLSKPNIFLSHDWPRSIEQYGNTQALLRRKPFFRQDINSGNLGSPPLMELLRTLRPDWWFSAHLHVRFEAIVKHGGGDLSPGERGPGVVAANPEEILISDEDVDADEANITMATALTNEVRQTSQNPEQATLDREQDFVKVVPRHIASFETKFIALDKCLPRRDFLEIVEVPTLHSTTATGQTNPLFTFDPEWLAITRAFHQYFTTTQQQATYPDEPTARARVAKELEWIEENIVRKAASDGAKPSLFVDNCQAFAQTAPGPGSEGNLKFQQPPSYTNPQTVAFCSMLCIDNKI